MSAGTAPRRGRRPGGADTRGAILAAARSEFAARGYEATSVRGIARAAGVDPALVHHFYGGGKEEVFVAAMGLTFDPAVVLPQLLAGDPATLGERVVRFMLGVWGDEERRAPFLAMVAGAMTAEPAAKMLREFVSAQLLGRVVAAVTAERGASGGPGGPPRGGAGGDGLHGGPEPALRTTFAASQLIGLVVLRYVVKVEPLASASDDEVVATVGPVVQRYLTGPL